MLLSTRLTVSGIPNRGNYSRLSLQKSFLCLAFGSLLYFCRLLLTAPLDGQRSDSDSVGQVRRAGVLWHLTSKPSHEPDALHSEHATVLPKHTWLHHLDYA